MNYESTRKKCKIVDNEGSVNAVQDVRTNLKNRDARVVLQHEGERQ